MGTEPNVPSSSEPVEGAKQKWAGTTAEHCKEMIDYAKRRSPVVKFMIEKMEEVNCHWFLSDFDPPTT